MSVAVHVLPFDVLAAVVNPLLKELCPASEMILMKLPSPEEGKAGEYMKALRALVKDLPPMLLMNSSTHLPVITRYISSVCSTRKNAIKAQYSQKNQTNRRASAGAYGQVFLSHCLMPWLGARI